MNVTGRRILSFLFVAALVVAVSTAAYCVPDSDLGEAEVKMGKEAVVEINKAYKLSENEADINRVREIGNKIAKFANEMHVPASYGSSKITPFEFEFYVIDSKDVNAFSVPGGFIYVMKGLLDFVQSDHELAAVLAHEITHNSHHHMVFLLKEQAKLNNQAAIVLLAGLLGGVRSGDLSNVMLGAQLYQMAVLNGYSMNAERDSDRGAIHYAIAAGYNPVGLLTFLERLAKRPELIEYGIYRSHPIDAERVANAKNLLTDLNIKINRRETTNALKALVKDVETEGVVLPQVFIDGRLIFSPAPRADTTAQQVASETADKINKALDSGINFYELRVDPMGGGVLARAEPILVPNEADAELMGKTTAQITADAAAILRNVLWQQLVGTIH